MAEDELITGSIAMNLNKSDALLNYEVPEEKHLFQTDKNCAICQAAFGAIGIVHAKKILCKFCGRGVCAKCCPEKLEHPITKKQEKICSICMQKLMETHLAEDFNQQLDILECEKTQRLLELECMNKEKQMDASYNQYIEQQLISETTLWSVKLKDLKMKVKDMENSQEGTRLQHRKLYEDYQKFRQDSEKKNATIETLEKNLSSIQTTFQHNKGLLPDLRNKIGELQDIEFHLKNKIKDKKTLARSLTLTDKEQKVSTELDELRHKIHVLEGEKLIFLTEIGKITEENSTLDEKILSTGLLTRTKSSDSLVNSSSLYYSEDEESRIRELKEKSKENQKVVQALRVRLEAQKIFTRKSKMDTAHPEPGSRPCAKCEVF